MPYHQIVQKAHKIAQKRHILSLKKRTEIAIIRLRISVLIYGGNDK